MRTRNAIVCVCVCVCVCGNINLLCIIHVNDFERQFCIYKTDMQNSTVYYRNYYHIYLFFFFIIITTVIAWRSSSSSSSSSNKNGNYFNSYIYIRLRAALFIYFINLL